MNTLQIGRDFESEAYNYLKEKFDEVIWFNSKSTYDFKVRKGDKEFFVEAKIRKNGIGKKIPNLTNKQRNVDFLITKIMGEIKIYDKNFIIKNVYISNDSPTIKISDNLKKELDNIKIIKEETYNHVIKRAIDCLKNNEHN